MSLVNLRIDRLGGLRGALEKLGAYLLFAGRLLLVSPRALLRPGLVVLLLDRLAPWVLKSPKSNNPPCATTLRLWVH